MTNGMRPRHNVGRNSLTEELWILRVQNAANKMASHRETWKEIIRSSLGASLNDCCWFYRRTTDRYDVSGLPGVDIGPVKYEIYIPNGAGKWGGGSKWWWKIIFKDFMRQCTFRSWHPKENSFRSDGLKTRFTYYPLSHEFITIYNRLHSKTFRLVLICSSLGFFPFLSPRFSSRITFTVQRTWRSRSCPTPFPYRRYGFRDGYPYFCKRIVSTSMIYALGRVTDR